MSKIVFTGGATASGGYLVAKLKEEGHKVFTIGKGDQFNMDFRFMGTGLLQTAMAKVLTFFKGAPDMIVHNARISEVANLNHTLFANINARIFLDHTFLNTHEGKDTPFRSIHILGWGPEWADPRAEIVVSNAAQQALPTALVSRVKPLEQAKAEYAHRRELAERKHAEDQKHQHKIHKESQERTFQWHKARKEEYEKKPFEPQEYRDKIGDVWVPNVDAVLLIPHPDDLANGLITRERIDFVLRQAVEIDHDPGNLASFIVTK